MSDRNATLGAGSAAEYEMAPEGSAFAYRLVAQTCFGALAIIDRLARAPGNAGCQR